MTVGTARGSVKYIGQKAQTKGDNNMSEKSTLSSERSDSDFNHDHFQIDNKSGYNPEQ